MSLIPQCHFWIVEHGKIRVARLKRRTDKGVILTVFRNDDDAWAGVPIWDSYFSRVEDLIFLEGYPDCLICSHQACLEDTYGPRLSGSREYH